MSLLQKIKDDSVLARKARDHTATFLVTLYAEAAKVGKDKRNDESTDEETISVLKKFKAGALTMIDAAISLNNADAQTRIDDATREIKLIDQYLPKMLSESELRIILVQYYDDLGGGSMIRDERLQIGNFMSKLKKEYAGLYEGALANKIIKEILDI